MINISIREIYECCSHRDVSKREIEFIRSNVPDCHRVVVVIIFLLLSALCTFNFRKKGEKGGRDDTDALSLSVPERVNLSMNPIRSKKLVTRQRSFSLPNPPKDTMCDFWENPFCRDHRHVRACTAHRHAIQMRFFAPSPDRAHTSVCTVSGRTNNYLPTSVYQCVSRARPRGICTSA